MYTYFRLSVKAALVMLTDIILEASVSEYGQTYLIISCSSLVCQNFSTIHAQV